MPAHKQTLSNSNLHMSSIMCVDFDEVEMPILSHVLFDDFIGIFDLLMEFIDGDGNIVLTKSLAHHF